MNFVKEHQTITAVFSSLAIGYLFHQYSLLSSSNTKDNDNTEQKNPYPIRIKGLFIYPVKSIGGIQVKSLVFDKYGIVNDRRWVLIKGNIFLSQKTYPKLATIQTKFSDDGKSLIMSAEGHEDLVVSAESLDSKTMDKSKLVKVRFTRDEALVYDCGDEASSWFNKILGTDDVRFCQLPPDDEYYRGIRQSVIENLLEIDNVDRYQQAYCNSAPVMVLSQASIDELNARVDETRTSMGEALTTPLTWDRFRPNILVSGTRPFEEDDWKSITIENQGSKTEMIFGDNNGRCPIVTIDQQVGKFDPQDEPQRTLKTFRLADTALGQKTIMGMYCVLPEKYHGNSIQVGNVIQVKKNNFKSTFHFPINIPK